MIKARHTLIGNCVARYFSGPMLDRAFRPVRIVHTGCDNDLPVLLIANHFCWWDGFIQYRLNRETFRRKLHVMMLEEQLRKFRILNQCGVFSIHRQSRQMLESLQYTTTLLRDKKNMVLLFPQGEIQSLYSAPFRFGSGLDYLLNHLENEIQLVFNINLVDYYSRKCPSLTIYSGTFDYRARKDVSVEDAFNQFAESCKLRQIPE